MLNEPTAVCLSEGRSVGGVLSFSFSLRLNISSPAEQLISLDDGGAGGGGGIINEGRRAFVRIMRREIMGAEWMGERNLREESKWARRRGVIFGEGGGATAKKPKSVCSPIQHLTFAIFLLLVVNEGGQLRCERKWWVAFV